ncbi:hypothetical protein Bbelb_185360 [Branchiostoma belcheri]|nr:hypothetical protein Bbelb_185360 [Branchiostoma belcheri]
MVRSTCRSAQSRLVFGEFGAASRMFQNVQNIRGLVGRFDHGWPVFSRLKVSRTPANHFGVPQQSPGRAVEGPRKSAMEGISLGSALWKVRGRALWEVYPLAARCGRAVEEAYGEDMSVLIKAITRSSDGRIPRRNDHFRIRAGA